MFKGLSLTQIKQTVLEGESATIRISRSEVSVKKVFLKISQNSQEITCARVYWPATLLKKETLSHVFSCKYFEIFKNIFFYRTLPVATAGL